MRRERKFVAMLAAGLLVAGPLLTAAANGQQYVAVPGGTFSTVLGKDVATVAPFAMRALPVTTAEFAQFTRVHTEWQRGRVDEIFADGSYLQDWPLRDRRRSGQPARDVRKLVRGECLLRKRRRAPPDLVRVGVRRGGRRNPHRRAQGSEMASHGY